MAEALAENKSTEDISSDTLEKIHSNVKTPHIGLDYFESKEYLNMIPETNSNWIHSELELTTNKYDATNLDNFTPPKSEQTHPYYNDIISGLNIFKQWRHWKESNDKSDKQSWKYLKTVNNELKIYWTHIQNETISAIKSEMIVPYCVPIITGLITNDEQCCKYNKNIEQQQQLQNISSNSLIWHCNVKKPMRFISSRDMLTVRFIYILPNAEVICGEKSIPSHPNDKWLNNNKFVRAECTLNLWHIRPYYKENDINIKNTHSFVTYYTHFKPNGSIPQWIVDQKIAEKAENILSVKRYIDSIKDILHKKGILFIPYPLMKMMKVFNVSEKEVVKDEVESKEKSENEIDENVVVYQKEVYGIDPTQQN